MFYNPMKSQLIIINPFYEKHDVNTPPFMAGMKRHPLKKIENQLRFPHGHQTNESCGI